MWCWHRIRESESGLCPACRTPYGEDPHQFSAVDVEEVLKANKEKEVAAKRERHRQSQIISGGGGGGSTATTATSTTGGGTVDSGNSDEVPIEVPRDRMQLANMRVIRRNLVYAVGLPPAIANEEILRKAEYFGQYGRLAKIVLNRAQVTAADARRASASAYVTFVHKEDTLACILALDGFYLENRNIRASYGTSKYCSAFIKGVRCNNPECTYLHEMGAAEDTFTKQEIQAGYVTSGRDVLARQQQIMAEQLRLAGSSGGVPRKRTGGGGPSGTGKAAATPVFPAPEYDEQCRPAPILVPPPTALARSQTMTTGVIPVVISNPVHRSASIGASYSPPLSDLIDPGVVASGHRKVNSGGATAASVVAGVHNISAKPDIPDPHTTLTPLTPLKRVTKSAPRAVSLGGSYGASDASLERLALQRNGGSKRLSDAKPLHGTVGPLGPPSINPQDSLSGVSSIGGDVIGPPLKPRNIIGDYFGSGFDSLGREPISTDRFGGSTLSSALGGEVFTGQLPSRKKSAIGSGVDKWNSSHVANLNADPMLGRNDGVDLWGKNHTSPSQGQAPGPSGGGVIGSHLSSQGTGNSSSALASILGINLPTGSGSLNDSSSLWSPSIAPHSPSPLSSLNGSALPTHGFSGGHSSSLGSSLIGGVPIGGGNGSFNPSGTIGGGDSKNDIALLQSLLPGVHITSDSESLGFGGGIGGWDMAPGPSGQQQGLGLGSLRHESLGSNWGGRMSAPGQSVGAIGQNNRQQNQRQGPGIW
jgi:CCR4-NOT transcription complex subunit 4